MRQHVYSYLIAICCLEEYEYLYVKITKWLCYPQKYTNERTNLTNRVLPKCPTESVHCKINEPSPPGCMSGSRSVWVKLGCLLSQNSGLSDYKKWDWNYPIFLYWHSCIQGVDSCIFKDACIYAIFTLKEASEARIKWKRRRCAQALPIGLSFPSFVYALLPPPPSLLFLGEVRAPEMLWNFWTNVMKFSNATRLTSDSSTFLNVENWTKTSVFK